MSELVVPILFWVAAAVGCELATRGLRVQTVLPRVLAIYLVVGGGFLTYSLMQTTLPPLAAAIFWGGAFLSWFGVRSHLESSILLRIVYLLRSGPCRDDELIACYTADYGSSLRVDELVRAGLATRTPAGLTLTAKGRVVQRIASLLRSG